MSIITTIPTSNSVSSGLELAQALMEAIKNPKLVESMVTNLNKAKAANDAVLASINEAQAKLTKDTNDFDVAKRKADAEVAAKTFALESGKTSLQRDMEAHTSRVAQFEVDSAKIMAQHEERTGIISNTYKALAAKEKALADKEADLKSVFAETMNMSASYDIKKADLDKRETDITAREARLRAALG